MPVADASGSTQRRPQLRREVAYFQLSALTRRALRLCGERVCTSINRREAENAEVTQRKTGKLRHYPQAEFLDRNSSFG